MLLVARSIERSLTSLTGKLLDSLESLPPDALNTWKPAAARDGSHAMNTFAALAAHAFGAAENWTLIITGAHPATRDRDAEFRAQTTLAALRAKRDAWLADLHTQLAAMTEADFAAPIPPSLVRSDVTGWTVLDGMMHAIDHTALHLGHVQIQRQLWEYEKEAATTV